MDDGDDDGSSRRDMEKQLNEKKSRMKEEALEKNMCEKGYKKEIPIGLWKALYDFQNTYEESSYKLPTRRIVYHQSSGIQAMMELVLSVPATEAVCERFFRHSSLFAKRQYVTNLNE